MGFQLPEPPVNGYGVVAFVASIIIFAKLFRGSNVSIAYGANVFSETNYNFQQLDVFPVAGSNNWFGSWWAGLKFLTNAQTFIQEGYKKASPSVHGMGILL